MSDHAHHHHIDAAAMDSMSSVVDGPRCNMNMLFTWNTTNLCIVFRQWRISSPISLLLSLLAVLALGVGYEALRSLSRRCDVVLARPTSGQQTGPDAETVPLLGGDSKQRAHLFRSMLYGLQNFYALMLMLVFMTYNGWIMLAVSLGTFLGFYLFGAATPATKETACH